MKTLTRGHFIASIAGGTVALTTADAIALGQTAVRPIQLGESRRFPGFVLKAYEDSDGEVYLAYSAEALARVIAQEETVDLVRDFVEQRQPGRERFGTPSESSGKSTTVFASLVKILPPYRPTYNIEDAIEITIPGRANTEYVEVDPDTVFSNQESLDGCDGRCDARSKGLNVAHDCFLVRDRINEWVRAIDAGELQSPPERGDGVGKDGDRQIPALPFHPSTAGIVEHVWTNNS